MADRTIKTKAQLLAEIERAWDALNAYLAPMTDAQMTGVNDEHGWSVKDHLVHIAAWEDSVVFFLQGKSRYEALGVDETLFANGGFVEINDVIQELRKGLSFGEAIAQLHDTHAKLMALLHPLTDADLNEPLQHFFPSSPASDQRLAIDLIRDNTADHFLEHLGWMKVLVAATD